MWCGVRGGRGTHIFLHAIVVRQLSCVLDKVELVFLSERSPMADRLLLAAAQKGLVDLFTSLRCSGGYELRSPRGCHQGWHGMIDTL